MTLNLSLPAIQRCMRSAANRGYDPYNSHPVQAHCFQRAWTDKARRAK